MLTFSPRHSDLCYSQYKEIITYQSEKSRVWFPGLIWMYLDYVTVLYHVLFNVILFYLSLLVHIVGY